MSLPGKDESTGSMVGEVEDGVEEGQLEIEWEHEGGQGINADSLESQEESSGDNGFMEGGLEGGAGAGGGADNDFDVEADIVPGDGAEYGLDAGIDSGDDFEMESSWERL